MSGIALKVVWGALLLVYVWLLLKARRRTTGEERKFHLLRDPAKTVLEYPRLYREAIPWLERPRLALAALGGGTCDKERLIDWAAEALGQSFAALLAFGFLGIAAGSGTLAVLGVVVAALLPALRYKELTKKVEARRQAIVLELPELLSRLTLMVNAGENVMRALERCSQRQEAAVAAGHPLYAELSSALAAMKRGEPFVAALEEFGRRCAVPEAKLFATTLLTNARRGGETFVTALRELSRSLWERRKAVARTLGEQASSRMAFPLAIIFLLIMVLVGAPSMLMMSN